jgi:hypothetical protein
MADHDAVPSSRQSPNTLKTRVVPIVFVPGLMGTRLSFDQGDPKLKWDPDSKLGEMLPWLSLTATEKARVLNYKNPAKIIDEKKDNGWGALPNSVYGKFQEALVNRKFGSKKTPVYAAGYDWRQSCATSARLLTTKINAILKAEKAPHLVLVTHSMGGLVARSAVQQTPSLDNGQVIGIAHVAQPVAGAVALYRRLFTGMQEKWDGGQGISKILGNTPYEFIVPMSGIPGVFELLPTHQYRYVPSDTPDEPGYGEVGKLRGPWESPEKGHLDGSGRTVYPHGISKRYLNPDSPPGMFNDKIHGSRDPDETKRTKDDIALGVISADAFHQGLALRYHKNTWAIYSTGVHTDVAVKYPVQHDQYDDLMVCRREEGDGTVPDASAAALFFKSVEASVENARRAENRQFFVNGAEHAGVFDNNTVRDVVFQLIYNMVQFGD